VVGTLQPIDELARITKEHGALLHTDAVQAAGKIPLDVTRLPADLIALSAHKLHGPKGVGALYVRRGVKLSPIVFGGGQERGLRSATENVAGIVGFGAAARLAREGMIAETTRLRNFRQRMLEGLRESIPGLYLIGHPEKRLPGHLSVAIRSHESRVGELLQALDTAGIAVSAGSACNAHHEGDPSGVLLAMGLDSERARGLIRITLGRFNTQGEVERFLDTFARLVSELWPTASSSQVRPNAQAEVEAVST
jgi:cysteine desulfurase